MPTLRWFAASGTTVASPPKLRVYAITGSGAQAVAPKLRVFSITTDSTGTTAPVLTPPPNSTSEPMATITLTASPVAGSSTPDTYVWRVVSGGPATLNGTGATITCVTPAPRPPAAGQLVVGVRGVTGGFTGPEVTCTITVLPATRFSFQSGQWVGVRAVGLSGP